MCNCNRGLVPLDKICMRDVFEIGEQGRTKPGSTKQRKQHAVYWMVESVNNMKTALKKFAFFYHNKNISRYG